MKPVRFAVLLVVGMIAAACSDTDAGPDPGGSDVAPSTTAGTVTASTLVPPVPTDPPEIDRPMIGELEIPCGVHDSVDLAAMPGVDDESITVGTGNDRGGTATFNAGRGMSEAVLAVAGYCNSLGGIAGRDIVVVSYDAAVVETQQRVADACEEVLAMVGFRYLMAAEATIAAARCGLPTFAVRSLTRSPFPLHGHFAAIFAAPAEAGLVVLVGPDTPTGAVDRQLRADALSISPVPIEVVGEIGYPIDEAPDWGVIVAEARATGAGLVHLSGGCDHAVVPFLEIAAAAGWGPLVLATTSAYDPSCLADPDLVGRLLIELPLLPFEDGDAAPATAAHAELLDGIGAPRTGDALMAVSSFWRWVVSTAMCGPELDRACLIETSGRIDAWDAGGLHAVEFVDGTTEPCVVVMGVDEGAFVRLLPAEPGTYDCTPDWSVDV